MPDDLHRFQFAGGPIDAPEDATEVFQAIGHVAASWSRLEQHIDALLLHVNKGEFSAKLYDPDHPVSFKRKLALLKRWFNQHPALEPYAENMRELTSRLKPLAGHSNTYLHSILESYNRITKKVVFRSVRFTGNDMFRFSRREIPLEAITSLAETVNAGNRFRWSMTSEIFTPDGVKQLQTA